MPALIDQKLKLIFFRDKLERYDPKYYEEFGKGMVDKYRERALRLFNYDTFGRFANLQIDHLYQN